ncbi:nitrate- and nitrite sensing domain-containing protein [Salinimonas lutimaris]|uniref:nitrate- and nitrite sensing domain-containing protein n=1 Tax=Salinimonas lutimaris TaxID=914153 RepID=UPI001586711A|nr:nitrate- and nitrite sensing domain-containing protein [Salinimonas lutimaris]
MQQYVELFRHIDALTESVAKERGLTAGYASTPTPIIKKKVDNQRLQSDSDSGALQMLADKMRREGTAVPLQVDNYLSELSHLKTIRDDVDNKVMNSAFLRYSTLNQHALDASQALSYMIGSASFQSSLTKILIISELKERYGQLRGKVNGILSEGNINEESRLQMRLYHYQTGYLRKQLESQLSDHEARQFSHLIDNKYTQKIDAISEHLLASDDLSSLPKPQQWFRMATAHIENLNPAKTYYWENVVTQKQVQQPLTYSAGFIFSVMGLCAMAVIYMFFALVSARPASDDKSM